MIDTYEIFDFRYRKNVLYCNVQPRSAVLRTGRWAVSEDQFPDNRYPPYCPGLAFVTSIAAVQQLQKYSYNVRFLWVDDVFLTGVITQVAKIMLIAINNFYGDVNKAHGKPSLFVTVNKPVIVENYNSLWQQIRTQHIKKCVYFERCLFFNVIQDKMENIAEEKL
jgi:hypothetical protein